MQALSPETYHPKSDYQADDDGKMLKDAEGKPTLKPDAQGYKIKPLSSLQFMEVMTDGFEVKNGVNKMNSIGVRLLLSYGLQDPAQLNKMPALHLVEVAQAIYQKAAISEAERKN